MRKGIISLLLAVFLRAAAYADGMEMSGTATLFREPYGKGPFVELLLAHSSGKRSGYDKRSGRILTELPESCYVEQGIGIDPKSKSLVVAAPLDGSYTLFVAANDSGIYMIDADVMKNEEYVTKSISGLVRKGDFQEIEVLYTSQGEALPVIRKKIDMTILKKELEIALIKGRLDRSMGKDAALDLAQAERALANRAVKDAVNNLNIFIKKLEERRAKYLMRNDKDIRNWFAEFFTEDPNDMREIRLKKDIFFQNIGNIRDERKYDWFEAQSIKILIEDAKLMIENIAASRFAK